MPLTREMVSVLPHTPGVYIYLDDEGKELYVGKAKDLRKRVSSYLSVSRHDYKTAKLVASVVDLKYIETQDEIEALIVESRLIRELKPPFNIQQKDTDWYPYLEVTLGDDFPKVNITRSPDNKRSRYIGPFTDVYALRVALRAVQPIFRFCACSRTLTDDPEKTRFVRPCLNSNIGLCDAPCAGRISKEEYRKKIKALILFFSGRKDKLIRDLTKTMELAANELRYEEAAVLRDQIKALQKLAKPSPLQIQAVAFVDLRPEEALAELERVLNLRFQPHCIEGYDISNFGAEDSVGSRVTFIDGMPYRAGYRRYRIKTVPGQNDFASLAEVLKRRIARVMSGEEEAPSLILLDGGQGQVNTVHEALFDCALQIPMIGLAKKDELIHFTDGRPPLSLSKRSPALRLLQQIRDEAHRFAQHYHHILRAKRVFGAGFRREGRR